MDTQRLYLKVCEQCGCQFESHFAVTAFPFFAIFPLKIARPPTIFVRALGESPALGHAARDADDLEDSLQERCSSPASV